jgi:hypothetical protein
MKPERRYLTNIFILFPLSLLFAACTVSPPPAAETGEEREEVFVEEAEPYGVLPESAFLRSEADISFLCFEPAGDISLEIPPGVGLLDPGSGDPAAPELTRSFRETYLDGLFRGLPLSGVLGGDLVHGWPPQNPAAWAQNWRGTGEIPNSWGLPSLILAAQGFSGSRPFIVQGILMDAYGRSAGIGRANGVLGYGAPLGEDFLYEGQAAQRFEKGLLVVETLRGNGLTGEIHFEPAELPPPPETLGVFTESPAAEPVSGAFRAAWPLIFDKLASPSGTVKVDAPGTALLFPAPWQIPLGETGRLSVRGIYIQSLDEGKALLLLADYSVAGPGGMEIEAGLRARLLVSPFLDALIAEEALAGLPAPSNPPQASGGKRPDRLLEGLARYGIPLSDPLFRVEDDSCVEVQRFSRGWIVGKQYGFFLKDRTQIPQPQELPAPETPESEIPTSELPVPEIPELEFPASEIPTSEIPESELPAPEILEPEIPASEIPELELPAVEIPAPEIPASEIPATEITEPELPAPEIPQSSSEIPESEITE